MKLAVLGCYGGIGGARRTTALLLDDDVLIDAGSGVGDLSLEQMARVDHVFLTHSHLDHCGFIPLLADAAAFLRKRPLLVHALPQTIAALKENLLNGKLWPDYSVLPTAESLHPLCSGHSGRDCAAGSPAHHAVAGTPRGARGGLPPG